MIIDIHGHYTTEPQALHQFRDKQLAGLADAVAPADHDRSRHHRRDAAASRSQPQLKLQKERGSDLTIFSPRAAGMAHHVGTEAISLQWTTISNDLIHRICTLLPDNFAAVGQLPQHPGRAAEELHSRAASASSTSSASSASTSIPIRPAATGPTRR